MDESTDGDFSGADFPILEDLPELLEEEKGVVTKPEKGAVGDKNIGTWGSFVFIINQIFGPGVLAIPIVFQQAGWVGTVIVLILFCIISSFSATLLVESIRMIPGNLRFEKRYEYTTTVRHYFGKKAYILFQISINICLQSLNIASIIVCAQSIDSLLVFICGKSYALQFLPTAGFISGNATDVDAWYSSSSHFDLTIGYIIVMALCIPMGMVNLDENIKFQWISFFGLVIIMLDLIFYLLIKSPFYTSQVPAFGDRYTQLASVCIFAWAFVMLVPSWANEKKEHVSINKTIWIAALISTLGYAGIGVLCALTFKDLNSDDILKRVADPGNFILTRLAAYLFALFIIAPGIPVYCITTKYNLYIGGICGRKVSFFFGVIAPWLVGFIFTAGPIFADFLTWSALIFSGFVNFILPIILYLKALKVHKMEVKSLRSRRSSLTGLHEGGLVNPVETVREPLLGTGSMIYVHDEFKAPFPKFLKKYSVPFSIILVVVMSVMNVGQILMDLYYLIFKHEDVLS